MNASVNPKLNAPQNTPTSTQSEGVDVVKMLWRWKALIAIGLLLGLAAGYLLMIQMPYQYTSQAMIQILSPKNTAMPNTQLDIGESQMMETRQDEMRVMKGERVVGNAIKDGRLAQNPILSGMSPEEIYAWIINDDRLDIQAGTKESQTDILDIQFVCQDKELAAEVLQALLSGYQTYLTDVYSDRGSEVFDKLAKYRDIYDSKFKTARSRYIQLRKEMPVIWMGNETRDPFGESSLTTGKRVQEIGLEIQKIDSVLNQVQTASEAGRSPDVLLNFLQRETLGKLTDSRAKSIGEIIQAEAATKGESGASAYLDREILNIKMERDKFSTRFGKAHPSVLSLDNQLLELEKRLEVAKVEDDKRREKLIENIEQLGSLNGDSPVEGLRKAVASLQEERAAMVGESQSLSKIAAIDQSKSRELQGSLAELEMLQDEFELMKDSATELTQALQGLQLGSDYNQKKMFIHNQPKIGRHTGPKLIKYLGVGGIGGLLAFAGLAYLLEIADRSFRSPEEVLRSLHVPVLGHVPIFEVDRRDVQDEAVDSSIITLHKPQSNTSECYRGIRTALFFANKKNASKVIQVTSPLPGDGKSTLATNTAVSLAQSGRNVLYIDCDLRRPRGAKIFGVKEKIGLSTCLNGESTLEQAIQASSIPNLSIITSGARVPNPSELLVLPEFEELLAELRTRFDYIIIDTPPMLSVSDPANVAPLVDAVILTMRLRRNSRPIAEQAKNILDSVNANIIGIVINGVGNKNSYGYGGYRYETSGMAGYTYGTKSYGYGGSEKVYGDDQMQSMVGGGRTGRSGRRGNP